MAHPPSSAALSAIQNNSDLSQGLKRVNGGTVERKDGEHLDAAFERKESRSSSRQFQFDWATRRCAMNVSVTQFTVAPAMVAHSRSFWHEIIDTVIEGPPRTAANEIAEYLERHQYDLSPALRIELERRHVCV
jgi:hypothetical protein